MGCKAPTRIWKSTPTVASTLPTIRPMQQKAISDSLHEAVCGVTGSDGVGLCFYYSAAGAMMLATVVGRSDLAAQAMCCGKLRIRNIDPSDPELRFEIDPEASPFGSGLGEFHCWNAIPSTGPSGPFPLLMIDFTARHYRTMVEGGLVNLGGERAVWRRGSPPDFLWYTAGSPGERPRSGFAADVEFGSIPNSERVVLGMFEISKQKVVAIYHEAMSRYRKRA